MRGMNRNPIVPVRMTDKVKAALEAHAKKRKISLSEFIRDAALRAAGREDLIDTMRRGRPKEE